MSSQTPCIDVGEIHKGTSVSHISYIIESCKHEQRWYWKKYGMEAHLWKTHCIDIVLPRGMRMEEEGTPGACFNNYERQRSLKHFTDPKIKYKRNKQSHIRKLKIRVVSKFNSTPVELWPGTEVEFVAKFIEQELYKYTTRERKNGWRRWWRILLLDWILM